MERFGKALKTIFIISTLETFLVMLYLSLLPVGTSNETSGIFGFSGIRFVILLLFLILIIAFLAAWIALARSKSAGDKLVKTLYKFAQRNSFLNLQSVLILGIVIALYLVLKWLALPSTYEYDITLPRLLPLGFLLFVLSLQAYIILFLSKSSPKSFKLFGFVDWVRNGHVPAKRIALDLIIIASLVTIASIAGQMIKYFTPYYHYLDFLIVEFFLDSELNLPTYFQASMLLLSGILLAIKAQQVKKGKGKFVFHWQLLSLVFVYLACDEVLQIHEMLSEPTHELFHTSGAFFFAWYIPVIPVLFLLGLYYLKFILALPNRYKIGYIISGTAYLLGVIGFEIIGSAFGYEYGLGNFPYTMISTLEEVVEMTGLILFVYYNWDINQISNSGEKSVDL